MSIYADIFRYLQQSPHLKGQLEKNAFFHSRNAKKCNLVLAGNQTSDYKGANTAYAPFVYRLGRQIFILKRGVRLP